MSGTIVPAVRIRYRPRRVDDVALAAGARRCRLAGLGVINVQIDPGVDFWSKMFIRIEADRQRVLKP